MGERPLDGFVPVDGEALAALDAAVDALADARRELERASRALVELAGEMSADAVRGLRDRGASAAQIERYEDAHRASAAAVHASARALDGAIEEVRRAARRTRS